MRVRLVGVFWVIGLAAAAWPAAAQDPSPAADDLSVYRDTLDLLLPQPFALQPFMMAGSEAIYLLPDIIPLDTDILRK